MRSPNLLVLSLFGLILACAATASGQLLSTSLQSSAPTPSSNLDLLQPPAAGMAIDQYRLRQQWSNVLDRLAKNDEPFSNEVCYTMRIYGGRNSERFTGSDNPVEDSVCLPSSKIKMKNADEPAALTFP